MATRRCGCYETFKGLANGKDGVSVDKETFLKCFPMRGLLGERLFEVIDKDGSGTIHYNEFVYGLAILFRGSRKEKLKFVFDLYDLSSELQLSLRYSLLSNSSWVVLGLAPFLGTSS